MQTDQEFQQHMKALSKKAHFVNVAVSSSHHIYADLATIASTHFSLGNVSHGIAVIAALKEVIKNAQIRQDKRPIEAFLEMEDEEMEDFQS